MLSSAVKRTVLLVACLISACLLLSCSGSSYHLTKDESITTSWGTIVEFKIDPNWVSSEPDDSKYAALGTYHSEDKSKHEAVFVTVINSTNSTYADWAKSTEETYGKFADYSLTELNSVNVGDETFRTFKLTYTSDDSDKPTSFYYALLMNDTYNVWIFTVDNEQLLYDFMKTVTLRHSSSK